LSDSLAGVTGRVSARKIFTRICEAAWASGDPGLIFLDTIQRANPTPDDGVIESTNPCGEVPLLAWESCNLGSLNLTHFMSSRPTRGQLDWERLRQTVHDAVRFLDDVISVNRYPLPEVQHATEQRRKIGLGVMGFAEACILSGIAYDSNAALSFADKLMRFIEREAQHASAALAKERGTFPAWERSRYAPAGLKLRNATLTSIAPTGTISLIAGTSPGIEPLFGLAYRRVGVLQGQNLVELNPIFARTLGADAASRKVLEHVTETGSLAGMRGGSAELQRLFVTALQVAPEWHVRVQAAFQKHVDNAVSKTVNLPSDASVDQVSRVYRLAHQLGCKGITIFRQGSRENQVMQLGAEEQPYEHEYFTRCDPGACKL
jgi:ribonucleoside-diphosphate reductase alpha chain